MGAIETIRTAIKDFDEGRLMLQNSKYSRSMTVQDWKTHFRDPNGKIRKGWTSVAILDQLVSAKLLDADQKIFVAIDGGKEQWVK